MVRTTIRPMGVGQMLDRSFQVYRKLFSPLFLVTLIAFGPFYLLSSVLLVNVGALRLIPDFRFHDEDSFWLSRFPEELFTGGVELWLKIVGILLLGLVLVFLVIPVYLAMTMIMTNRALDGETPSLSADFREAWKRYGVVLGNSVLYNLISFGIYFVVMMISSVVSMMFGFAAVATTAPMGSEDMGAAAGITYVIVYVVLSYGGALGMYYFNIRFGYLLPPVLFEKEGIGLGRSWSLTRRSFWRLFAVYIVYGTLAYVFAIALGLVVAALGASIAGLLSALVVLCALIPIVIVIYIVTYRVQKVRTDADDVEALLLRLRGPIAEPPQGGDE